MSWQGFKEDTVGTEEVIAALRAMSEEDRQKVYDAFCRSCNTYIGEDKDWSGRNYCYMCSPDPRED